MTDSQKISFSFGENWLDYLDTVDEDAVQSAMTDILSWLPPDAVKYKPAQERACSIYLFRKESL